MPQDAIGCGFHEAVRGVLSHHVVIRDGKIANYHPYPPTPWNANPRDIYGTPGPYEDAVQNTPIFEENGPDKFKGIDIMRAVRSFDPCLPCGVHMYLGNGKVLETHHSPMFGMQRLTILERETQAGGHAREVGLGEVKSLSPQPQPPASDLSLKEPMAQDTALQKRIQRIGEIVEQLESAADPNTRAMAKELLESLMALHGAGLERILELAAEAGEAGESVIRKCGRDELVSSLLLLYGLHPEDLNTRVATALEKSRTYLESHTASAELVSIDATTARLSVRLEVKSSGCGSSAAR